MSYNRRQHRSAAITVKTTEGLPTSSPVVLIAIRATAMVDEFSSQSSIEPMREKDAGAVPTVLNLDLYKDRHPAMRLLIHADGACWPNPGPTRCGFVVRDGTGTVLGRYAKGAGPGTNNTAEWSALIEALRHVLFRPDYAAEALTVRMDSQLVVKQVTGQWRVKHAHLQSYRDEALRIIRALAVRGCAVRVEWVPREENAEADGLTR